MILIQMKKKNSLFFLILFIYTIILPKTFASNKNIKDELFVKQIKFDEQELITKRLTQIWIKDINFHINKYKRKIKIKEDYLKLIKIFPSNKNINSADISKELRKYKNILNGHNEKIKVLKNYYEFFSSDKYFDTYKVIYNLKFFDDDNSNDEIVKWVSLCSLNSNFDKEIIIKRKNFLNIFFFFGHEGHPNFTNAKDRSYKNLPESKVHKMVCNEFQKKEWIY